ncbi:Type II secretory pathway, pullulanase PulA [Maritimibacter sp. 55A14]|uniref:sulfotransferase family 2 domain-containing protein n=1 Tax=Maritimibacter sp. 55A14 TaxID=2174844 RepID=UPI000D607B3A|nr:sulfotransferase family 2 domain-containing protein [Maritimibacter sp. 55A14]PWE32324.1 Type II secretory pathway, pullulanase PulA [Maritimibacter sp. 55A14]
MIVSRGRRYIFVHAPKTGGTALAFALEGRAKADDILIGDTPKAVRRRKRLKSTQGAGHLRKHSRLADIEGLVSPAEIDTFFVLMLVRNPWDRMVSYYHWLRAQRFQHEAVALAQSLEFSAFLRHRHTAASIRAAPYASYVTGSDGTERCDLFCRIEHFERDIAPFEAHLGFALTPLERINASDRRADWRGYYSDADAAFLEDLCAPDIARFGYRFAG